MFMTLWIAHTCQDKDGNWIRNSAGDIISIYYQELRVFG